MLFASVGPLVVRPRRLEAGGVATAAGLTVGRRGAGCRASTGCAFGRSAGVQVWRAFLGASWAAGACALSVVCRGAPRCAEPRTCANVQSVSQIDTICQDVCRQMCKDSHRHLQGCVQMCRAKCVETCRRVQASTFVKFRICNIFTDVCKCFAYGICSHIEHFGEFLAAFSVFLWRFAYLNDKKCTNRPINRLFFGVCPMGFVPK